MGNPLLPGTKPRHQDPNYTTMNLLLRLLRHQGCKGIGRSPGIQNAAVLIQRLVELLKIWVVVKLRVPIWYRIIIGTPKRDHDFDNLTAHILMGFFQRL